MSGKFREYLEMLISLLALHALADFPLQGDFLAQGKNHHTELGHTWWKIALPAHAIIHAGFVLYATGSVRFALIEAVVHGATDWAKCDERLTIEQDQAIHIACKALYALKALD